MLGTIVGILPGIGPALTVALLLPVTFRVEPVSAFIMFAGIYYGAMYGGSTTSILMNTPGESGSMITALDGYQMARAGRASAALATAAIGSFVAGTIGTVGLTFVAPVLVDVGAHLRARGVLRADRAGVHDHLGGAWERHPCAGSSACFLDWRSAWWASTFRPARRAIHSASRSCSTASTWSSSWSGCLRSARRFLRLAAHETRSDHEGDGLDMDDARRLEPVVEALAARHPAGVSDRRASGRRRGDSDVSFVLAREAAVAASRGVRPWRHRRRRRTGGRQQCGGAGVLVPLLTFGLPTSATAAIMLAAFQQYNLQPGPLLFEPDPELVWGLIASLYIGNVMLLVLNLPLAPVWARLLEIPQPLLYGGIVMFATVGTYSLNNSVFDVGLMYLMGVVGFLMRRFHIPVAPAIIGLILGPMAEQQFRRALAIAQGDGSVFFTRPVSATLLAVAASCWPFR